MMGAVEQTVEKTTDLSGHPTRTEVGLTERVLEWPHCFSCSSRSELKIINHRSKNNVKNKGREREQ